MTTSFSEFAASAKFVDDLGEALEDELLNGQKGYVYSGSFWIAVTDFGSYNVLIGNTEITTYDIDEAEQFLWDNWADSELNAA